MKGALHFAHGNGLPSPCYQQLFEHLKTQFDCCYIDRLGHSPMFPVSDNWEHLVDQVIDSIQAQVSQPVIGVGHSLGGILTLLAAMKQPSLFTAIVVLDAPMLGRFKSGILRISKAFRIIEKVTPAWRSRKRRVHWHNREEVWSYLKSRALFYKFTEACLEDYIHYGMVHHADGSYTLRFNPEIEYEIYRTIPHTLYQYEGRLKIPTGLIYGSESSVVSQFDVRYMKKKYGIKSEMVTGGTHVFPMEYPEVTADLIIEMVNRF